MRQPPAHRGRPLLTAFAMAVLLGTIACTACSSNGSGLRGPNSDSGLSSGTDSGPATLRGLPRVAVDKYADKSCTALSGFLDFLQAHAKPDLGDLNNSADVRTHLITFLGQVRSKAEQLLSGLRKAGVPKVAQGEPYVSDSIDQIQNVVDIVSKDEARAKATDGSNKAAVSQLLESVGTDFTRLGNVFSGVLGNLQSKYPTAGKAIKAAEDRVPSCIKLQQKANDSGDSNDSSDTGTTGSSGTSGSSATTSSSTAAPSGSS